MHPRDRIQYRTGALKAAGLWRDPSAAEALAPEGDWVDARSNDYLGLAHQAVSRETGGPIGAGASRLISGTHPEHRDLERQLAEWLGFEECLLFSSGYAANLGVISALAGPGETILSDALNHASIIDGCRLSRADVVVLPHRDISALERALKARHGVRWVVTESYFGMDGDSPDLATLRHLCDAHDAALIVDEAHAIGVFGPSGRGLCAEQGVAPDVIVGGMGKALGIHGGFATCSRLIRDWLWNRARSLVFSTAPSPFSCSLALGRVEQVKQAGAARRRLRELEQRLAQRLNRAGVEAPPGRHGPLFPLILGSEPAVVAAAERTRELGVLCHPIRPPTVPPGSSRLRVTLRSDMSDEDVDRIARALEAAWRERNLGSVDALQRGSPPIEPNQFVYEPLSSARSPRLRLKGAGEAPGDRLVHDPPGAAATPQSGASPASASPADQFVYEPLSSARPSPHPSPAAQPPGDQFVYEPSGSAATPKLGASSPSAATTDHPPPADTVERHRAPNPGSEACTPTTPSRKAAAAQPPLIPSPAAVSKESNPASHPASSRAKRWIILGTGTGVGKTFVARSLVQALAATGGPVAGLKPVETGLSDGVAADATQLEALATHVKLPSPHPLYGFTDPVTPSRAARVVQVSIDLDRIATWVQAVASNTAQPAEVVIETAGGVFSPLSDERTNFELAALLDPATWILVAPNRLGVLHDVTSALHAMSARGRLPDWIVLSAPEAPDASTTSNREELGRLRGVPPIIELPRNDPRPLEALLR